MSENVFIPKMDHQQAGAIKTGSNPEQEEKSSDTDSVSSTLLKTTQYITVLFFGLLPLFFTHKMWATLGLDKIILALAIGLAVVIIVSFMALRRQKVVTPVPMAYIVFLAFALVAYIAAILSGDVQDAIRGSAFETGTAGFTALLALVMGIPLVFNRSKIMTIKAIALFGFSAALLLLYAVLRFIFGADFLTFSNFNVITATPIGNFNDLAILSGTVVLLSLVTMLQLPLKPTMQYLLFALTLLALFVLAVINFFNIWLVLGLFSLLLLIYQLSRNVLFKSDENRPRKTPVLLATTVIVCLVSALFVVTGNYLGSKIGGWTDVSYLEVRPSFEATVGIAKQVYTKDAVFGVGANRFTDAWRMYRDPSINNTPFWDTSFSSGSGFVPTVFVTLGLLGGLLLVAFHLTFLYLGYRMLLRSNKPDSYWYYLGSLSFTAAVFIWGMSYVYVPGTTILLLGTLFTGLTFVAYGSLLPKVNKKIPLVTNRQRGFMIMAVVMLVVVGAVSALYTVVKQYTAEASFNKAQVQASDLEEFSQAVQRSYSLYPDDRFLATLAQLYILDLNSLLGVKNPTKEQQRQVLYTAEQALLAAEQAIKNDPTNPGNHAIAGSVYSAIASLAADKTQREVALERAKKSLEKAEELDPVNPGYHLLSAQMYSRASDLESARKEIEKALEIKRNFTSALYLLAQLDISEGNTEAAIATTRSVIALEPNNPTRYFQLGILLAATGDHEGAVQAQSIAVRLNPQYANARYMMALSYLNLKQPEAALEQLNIVKQTNVDNGQLDELINKIESGDYEIPDTSTYEAPLKESDSGEVNVNDSISQIDSNLVTPVNTVVETSENKTGLSSNSNVQDIIDVSKSGYETSTSTTE